MSAGTHVVLGGGGVVGRETVRALLARGHRTTSVGRRPSTVDGVRSVVADLLVGADVARALEGAEVAYLVAGLPYSSRTWAAQWPVIVRNTAEAALAQGTHLVHLDNVYAYGRVDGPMTEDAPIAPSSRKGRVRAAALDVLGAAAARGLAVTIGRSSDFYGPGASTSAFNTFVLDRVAAGRRGTWLLDADQPHSLTYTPDVGEALVVLGTAPEARGRTWHLPTAPALTGRAYVQLAAGPGAPTAVMSPATLRLGALFSTAARETLEMGYQYTAPHVLDSTAFETAFGTAPTPVAEGVAAALAAARARRES
ncbi:NAD-dependent epimerase/dehydratase family protein [Kineococcus sp. T13]|uniref:NAD-dependent epimerase/dehydratase family protein n=1 Tax=Kineococcus vitellinus TaxID=2696565 RepID=UPI0014128EBE|nr:NAD-dependent epimerase/dehydratase family protein [Kineococcus vitellinus]